MPPRTELVFSVTRELLSVPSSSLSPPLFTPPNLLSLLSRYVDRQRLELLQDKLQWVTSALTLTYRGIIPSKYCDEFSLFEVLIKHRSCQDIPGAAFIVENKNWRFVLCLCFAGSLLWPGRSHKRHQHIPPPPTRCRPFFLCVSGACMCVRACSRGESMVDNFNPAESLVTFVFLCV